MKYILTIALTFFIFTGNVKAAPLHAYYCFNALETANNVVNAFDNFLNSNSSEGMSTHRLYAFPLNGENNITHCMVAEHSGPDQFDEYEHFHKLGSKVLSITSLSLMKQAAINWQKNIRKLD